jgi:hypothetical protein
MNPAGTNKNPRRAAAGRLNQKKRGPLSQEGRERLQAAARKNMPWRMSTGPATAAGKMRSAANSRARQKGALSVREGRVLRRIARDVVRSLEATIEVLRRSE